MRIDKEKAKKFIELGLSIIPVNAKKLPVIGSWLKFQSVLPSDEDLKMFDNESGCAVAVICGKVSGGLEVIDVDCKYDLTGNLFDRYLDEISDELKQKLVIQSTVNGGYHLIYRCEFVGGNTKLATRNTTQEEKIKNPHEKVKVLLETRGEGGYFLVQPSDGYKIIQRKMDNISVITKVERSILLNVARSFNEVVSEKTIPKEVKNAKYEWQKSPFEDFDYKCDVVKLLEEHGWEAVRDDGDKVMMKRPGTESKWSADYTRSKNWFTVYSSSTEFEVETAYRPYAVWATLNGITDWSEVSKKLSELGFGTKREKKIQSRYSFEVNENIENENYDFVSSWDDIRLKVEDFISGKIPMGLTTGYEEFDKYFLFKRGNLVLSNGIDNTGKTIITLWLAMISAVLHGWQWIIYSSENSDLSIMNTLMQFYSSVPIKDMTHEQRNEAHHFIERHFTHIKPDEIVDYKKLKQMVVSIYNYHHIDACLIDPFNSLDASVSNDTHTFNYSVLTDMKLWGRKHDVAIYLNCHVVTSAYRNKTDGYIDPPEKGDTEGGTKFPAKADEFLTIHRYPNHTDDRIRRITEIHVRKVKDSMTGGMQTSKDEPIQLSWSRGGAVFYEAKNIGKHPFNKKMNELNFDEIINDIPPF